MAHHPLAVLDQSEELPTSRDNGNDDDQVGNLDLAEAEASQLNDPYRFEIGEQVWVCTKAGNWHLGKVVSKPREANVKEDLVGPFWLVIFNTKFRRWFSPLHDDIKPNTPHTRRMLETARVGGKQLTVKENHRRKQRPAKTNNGRALRSSSLKATRMADADMRLA